MTEPILEAAPDAIPASEVLVPPASVALRVGEREPSGAAPRIIRSGNSLVVEGSLLAPRQFEVVRRFALGQTWAGIAREMGIGKTTVSGHRRDAFARYDVASLPELWAAMGWLVVPEAPE